MKDWIRDILFALFVGVAMPAMVLNFVTAVWREVPKQTQTQQEILQWVEQVPLSVKVRSGETVEEGDLDAYLVGVVLAEMPASFEPEALKAQAVVARTYARKARITGGTEVSVPSHPAVRGTCQRKCSWSREVPRRQWKESEMQYIPPPVRY